MKSQNVQKRIKELKYIIQACSLNVQAVTSDTKPFKISKFWSQILRKWENAQKIL